MSPSEFPARDETTVQFAHVAYQMADRFAARDTGIKHLQTWTAGETSDAISGSNVLVVSGFWDNSLLEKAGNLRFIQSIGAGYDQFPQDELRERGIRLASARGVNSSAVSEHAMALLLAWTRHIHTGRDNQARRHWRGMLSDLTVREDELGGKTMLIVGLGTIGSRLAKLAKAFDMRVVGTKRTVEGYEGAADAVYPPGQLSELLPEADVVVLTCPLTPETEKLIDEKAFVAMKRSAFFINVARGACVDEPALLDALRSGEIAGAAIDHFWDEPLPPDSPFWDIENLIITPHTGGETRSYEENVIDILLENLSRMWAGRDDLLNQVL